VRVGRRIQPDAEGGPWAGASGPDSSRLHLDTRGNRASGVGPLDVVKVPLDDPDLPTARSRDPPAEPAVVERPAATSGDARRNGRWVDHGQPKRCWLSPLWPDAAGVLAAGFDHPALRAHDDRKAYMVDVNQVVVEGETGLYAKLCAIADHRTPKGIRHELASILLVCAVAMLAGTGHVTGIAEWAGDLPEELLLRLHLRRSPSTNKVRPPSRSTLTRALAAIDRDRSCATPPKSRYGPGEDRLAARREPDLAQGPLLPTARHPAPPARVTATPAAMTEAGAVRTPPAKGRQCSSGCRSTASRSAVHASPTGGRCTCSRR